jgi:hypothetical protein
MTNMDGERRIEMARKCLRLISRIATRGACAGSPADVGYALEELSQVLFERTGSEERRFEPVAADQIGDLSRLHEELDFVDSCSSSVTNDSCSSSMANALLV